MFCSQSLDVNISLTSIEMIWKVSDVAANACRSSNDYTMSETVLMTMLMLLKHHASDSRPEVSL